MLGEEEFPVHFHEGKQSHLHISLVGDDHILTVIFDHRSSLGLVRLRVKRVTEVLLGALAIANGRETLAGYRRTLTQLEAEEQDDVVTALQGVRPLRYFSARDVVQRAPPLVGCAIAQCFLCTTCC